MSWPTSNHESPDVDLQIPAVTAPHYLWAFLQADGKPLRANGYEALREQLKSAVELFSQRKTGGQSPSPDVSDQRLRTWKSAFEEMGLLTVDEEGLVRATRFGRAIIDGWQSADEVFKGVNRHIANLGAAVANRMRLLRPGDTLEGIPPDADILPLRAIWRAFRFLDDRLHWQDINRVLGFLHYEHEIPQALERIKKFRERHNGDYSSKNLSDLNKDSLSDDPRHITPWLTRAGIGGLLIPSEMDSAGFRKLSAESIAIIDTLLAEPVTPLPLEAQKDRAAYIRYLMEPVGTVQRQKITGEDKELVNDILQAVQDFGSSKFIILSGLPGTGKSRAARIVADILTEGDPQRLKDVQFHESTTYEDFMEGFVPRPDGQGFERRDKTFRIINQRALDDPGRTHVLLIEEFTRANAHSVIGELLTFIEHRGRKFTLPLSQHEISIASNLIIIATMNPRDRSALTLDDAIIRRMHRVAIPPSVHSLKNMLKGTLPENDLSALSSWFEKNLTILPFGHGVFAGADSPAKLQSAWEGTVVPLLTDPFGKILDVYVSAHESFPYRGLSKT